jgi:fatty-acyl-CoA synthase
VTAQPLSRTILEGLERSASSPNGGGWVFHTNEGRDQLSYDRLYEGAYARANALLARGVRPGDPVGVLGPNAPDWVQWAVAVWLVGGTLVPISYPVRIRDREAYRRQVESMIVAVDIRVVAADSKFVPMVPSDRVVPWDESLPAPSEPADAQPAGPDDPVVLQFTSGSTATPKAAVLTNRAVMAGISALSKATGMVGGTDGFGWLPFFHDNGLFGQVIIAVVTPGTGHIMPTERFASNPSLWLKTVSDLQTRITCGPSSAWEMAIRMSARRPDGIDLSCLEMAIMAAEMIDPEVVDRLIEDGAALGLRPDAVAAAYGMAEAMLALTVTPIGRGLQVDEVDLEEFALGGRAVPTRGRTKRIASCGIPVEGAELRIVGEDGPVGDREVGEIQAKAPSLMAGYRGLDASDPFEGGWLRTGDQGYLVGGELYVTGRIKDIVIVTGKNYQPDDLEWAASRVDEVRVGRSVAFNPPGDDGHVVLAVELAGEAEYTAVARAVRSAVLNATGVTARTIVVLPKGSIPRTTSGKIRRAAVREAWGTGELMEMALAADPAPANGNGGAGRRSEEGVSA